MQFTYCMDEICSLTAWTKSARVFSASLSSLERELSSVSFAIGSAQIVLLGAEFTNVYAKQHGSLRGS
jgi:hypothetical protein